MKNLKDKLGYVRKIAAPALLLGAMAFFTLIGIGYCGRQCSDNLYNINKTIKGIYPLQPEFLENKGEY